MPFQPAADLPTITDGLQTVQLRRADTGALSSVANALSREIRREEAAHSNGALTAGDVAWHIPYAATPAPPRVGDQLIAANSVRHTILAVADSPLLGRWRCLTRNLALTSGLGDRITLQMATWTIVDDVVTQNWTTVATDLLAKIQPLDRRAHNNLPSRWRNATHQIFVEEPLSAAADYRVLADDRVFYVLACEQPDRIDAVPFLLALAATNQAGA